MNTYDGGKITFWRRPREEGQMNDFEALTDFTTAKNEAENKGEKDFVCPLCGGQAWWDRTERNTIAGCLKCGFRVLE